MGAVGRWLHARGRAAVRTAARAYGRISACLRRYALAFLGAWLIVAALFLGLYAAKPKPLPRSGSDKALGFIADVTPAFGRGYLLDVSIYPPSELFCRGDATVSVAVEGSREFWEDHAHAFTGSRHVALGIAGLRVRDARAYLLSHPQDLEELRSVVPGGRTLHSPTVVRVQDETGDGVGALEATVHGWGNSREPLLFVFETPDFIARRDLGSCWVEVPALTGALPQFAASFGAVVLGLPDAPSSAQLLAGHPVVRPAATAARATVVNPTGAVLPVLQPDPDYTTADGPTWSCHEFALPAGLHRGDEIRLTNFGPLMRRRGERVGPSPTVATFEADATRRTCAATVALVASGFAVSESALTFFAGVLLTLGGGLIVLPFARRPA